MNRSGFTLVEVIVSLAILAAAVVGLGSTTAHLARVAAGAENRALALQSVEDRISTIRLHPHYQELDSVFAESGVDLPALPGHQRSTTLRRIIEPGNAAGKFVDFTCITVTVAGPSLDPPISRTVAVGVS